MIYRNGHVAEVFLGDCRDSLRRLASGKTRAQTCVTSPPYFGLRDYGHPGQVGLEQTPEEYIAAMVEVFRCVRDVLADDGTLWLNIGDSYAGSWGARGRGEGTNAARPDLEAKHGTAAPNRHGFQSLGVKPKDLIGIPWMLAFALRADGWYLRQDIIWNKPNPMPESVRDRCTKAHEYVFLLSKSERYFIDPEGMKEPAQSDKGNGKSFRGGGSYTGNNAFNNHQMKARETSGNAPNDSGVRNRRSVWTVATRPYAGAHFATFPPALIEPCILAGSRPGDIVLDPFGGSGTTAGVALKQGRHAWLCELNPEYAKLMPDRAHFICTS